MGMTPQEEEAPPPHPLFWLKSWFRVVQKSSISSCGASCWKGGGEGLFGWVGSGWGVARHEFIFLCFFVLGSSRAARCVMFSPSQQQQQQQPLLQSASSSGTRRGRRANDLVEASEQHTPLERFNRVVTRPFYTPPPYGYVHTWHYSNTEEEG